MADIELKAYITEIGELLESEKNDEAVAHCRHILDYYPRNLDVYRLLGKGLLELGHLEDAADIFYRVLSAAPDDFIAHVGMAIIGEEEGDLDKAIGHMERASEAKSNNIALHSELKRLYGRRDGVEPVKIRLTRGALARLYLRGGNFAQAVGELQAALRGAPDRIDWQVLLAQVLWKDEQRIDAVEACQDVLAKLPDCVQVNSILFEIWHSAGREDEADVYWQRVESLDPYLAHEIRDPAGATQPPDLQIPRLDYVAPTPDEVMGVPDWVRDLGLGDEDELPLEADELDFSARMTAMEPESSAEFDEEGEVLPDWLRDMASADEKDLLSVPGQDEPDVSDEAVPDWPQDSQTEDVEQAEEPVIVFDSLDKSISASEAAVDEELPEWLAEAVEWGDEQAGTVADAEDEIGASDWLSEFSEEPADSVEEPEDLPDWLQAVQEEEPAAEDTLIVGRPAELSPVSELSADVPDWLLATREEEIPDEQERSPEEATELTGVSEEQGDLPDWLAVIQEDEPAGKAVIPEGLAEPGSSSDDSEDLPDWLLAIQDGETEGPIRMDEQADGRPVASDQPGEAVDQPPFDAEVEEPAVLEEGEPSAFLAESDVPSTLEKIEESVMVPSDDELGMPDDTDDLESLLSDPDDALAWLEKLAADQGAPMEELPSLQQQEEPEAASTGSAPDWHKESADETMIVSPGAAALPAIPASPEAELASPEAYEDLPDWLRDLDAQPIEPPPPIAPGTLPELDRSDIPDWLTEQLGEGESAELGAELAAMGADVSDMPTGPDEAAAWLEQLAASQDEPLEEYASIGSGLGLEEPELPSWLAEQPAETVPEAEADAALDDQPSLPKVREELAAPADKVQPIPGFDDIGEMPEDVDEAMAWLEQLAAAQGAPLEELPTISSAESGEPDATAWLDTELAPEELETTLLSDESLIQPVQEELEAEPTGALDEPELPEWLRESAETSETVVAEPAILEEPELPGWLREPVESVDEEGETTVAEPAASEEPELPEWLREPAEAIDEVGKTVVAEPAMLEEPELPEWLHEPVESVDEPVVAESALLEEPELPEWLREPAELADETSEPVVAEPAAAIEEPELPEWLREPVVPLVGEAEPLVAVPEAVVEELDAVKEPEPEPSFSEPMEPFTDVFALRQQVDAEPGDYAVRLALARALLDDKMLDDALVEYGELVNAGQELGDVTSDLERALESDPGSALARRVLGDSYVKQNRLAEALDAYRKALSNL